ncbi:unnamed protein product [Clonostachys byssicola]|uniref:Uncharacterized protein n=1 Tax=Clonostachys byssicola TaxID=160290 RepID=A0A9N9Y5C4_9HYPO|nr:unnamed protein product [Clonostachys byssicola]
MASSCALVDDTFGPHAGDCRGGFDLTLLFEESILIVPLCCLLLLAAPIRVAYLLRKGVLKVEKSPLLYCKFIKISIVLLIGAQIGILVLWTRPSAVSTRASLPAAALSLVSSIALLPLSYAEQIYSTRPSTILNLFLLLAILFYATYTRTLWLQDDNQPIAIATLVATLLKIFIIVFEAIEKHKILRNPFRSLPPESNSGVFGRWFFTWQLPLFRAGYSNQLEIKDLYGLDKHLGSLYLQTLLRTKWNQATKHSRFALLYTVLGALKGPILAIVFPRLCYIGFTFAQPFLISATLSWSEHPEGSDDADEGYGLIGAWFLVYVGIAVSMGQHQHLTYRAITMMRGTLVSALYAKATDISITAADPTAALTLMSADIERIDVGWRTAHEVWANLVEIAVAVYLLQRQLGIACLIPVGAAIFSIVGSIIAVSFVMARQALWLEAIEARIAVTSQVLGAMKAVKMWGLTDALKARIQAMRVDELRISGKFRRLLIWNMGLAYFAPIIAPILTFTAYSILARNQGDGGTLDTNRVFTSLSLFALLQEPLSSFVTSLSSLVGSIGCFERIQTFLDSDVRVDGRVKLLLKDSDGANTSFPDTSQTSVENEKPAQHDLKERASKVSSVSMDGIAVLVKDGAFGYDTSKESILADINIEVPLSKFTLIVGPVGSGKSTLLKAILGEASIIAGSVHVSSDEIAYCDQTPWHMNGTVRDSIIAFSPADERWYQQVLGACALNEDLRQLPKGDLTTIGSKGIVLSGGQSQRISLARAVYAQRDIIILDDVFSGLDAHTENTVFHNLLGTNGILRKFNTTVIVTSSRSKRIPYADHIISLNTDGSGCEQGNLDQLTASGGYVSRLQASSADWTHSEETDSAQSSTVGFKKNEAALVEQAVEVGGEVPDMEDDEARRRMGDVAIYKYYVQAIGWIPTIIFVCVICSYIFCQSFPTIWVNWWAAANAEHPNERLGYYLGIYAMLGVLSLLFLVVSCWQMIVTMVPLSGKNFHWSLLTTVLNAPMSFFAKTDAGITINRFSQDLQLIDMDLPITALNTFATFVLCIAQMILIAVGSYYTAIAFPFLLAALWLVQHVYLRTSRQLRFMDLEAKSPLYAQFTETVSGLATLRAFGWRSALEEKHHQLLDRSQRPYYLLYSVQRWLTLVLDMFVAGIAVLLIILITRLRGTLPTGLVGVALVNVILFSQNLKLLMMFWTNLETHIGAISRIKSFTSETPSEHEPLETQQPPSDWPSQGAITFDKVSAGYTDSEHVIKDLTLSIKPGQKIGICGRTGSGKSSLVSCLFRMIDLHGGSITVDGLDICTLPRQQVRNRLVGVPQDAFLIEGSSVRFNADCEGLSTDEVIADAIRAVELWDIVQAKGGLDAPIEELHLSHGQRQLFCLARAMLRPSTIVILDEATSSVDAHTDQLIRRVMAERFSNHTVLAIVHKLETALDDFDAVAVLDAGELREFGPPRELLLRGPDVSAFAALYEKFAIKADNSSDSEGDAKIDSDRSDADEKCRPDKEA